MDQIKQDILQLVEKHSTPVPVHQVMVEYNQQTGKHLYLQVEFFGFKSVAQFLAIFQELELEMNPKNMLDVKIRGRHMVKASKDDIPVRIEAPKMPESLLNGPTVKNIAVIRSYTTVKEDKKPPSIVQVQHPVSSSAPTSNSNNGSKKSKKRQRRNNRDPAPYHNSQGRGQERFVAQYPYRNTQVWNQGYESVWNCRSYVDNNNWLFYYTNWYSGNGSYINSWHQSYWNTPNQRSLMPYWNSGYSNPQSRRYF